MPLPDGFYAVPDPDDESVMTRWRVKGGKWSPHPAKTWYGPARPLRKDAPDAPGTDAYIAWHAHDIESGATEPPAAADMTTEQEPTR